VQLLYERGTFTAANTDIVARLLRLGLLQLPLYVSSLVLVSLHSSLGNYRLLLVSGAGLPDALTWVRLAALDILRTTLWVYFWAIFVYALLSMVAPGTYSPATSILEALCEPILGRIRRVVPAIGGLDLSPLWAGIGIQVALILLR